MRLEGLEALTGDDCHDPLIAIDVATLRELTEDRDRDAAGRLGEDAGRLGEQPNALADLVVGHASIEPPLRRASSSAYGPSAGLPMANDLAIVSGLTGRQKSCPFANAWATGEQPSAWAPLNVGV